MLHFESLIDSTDFGTVRRSLRDSSSPITQVLFVHEERLLATVAELITDEHPTDAQRAQFARWIQEGHLAVGVQSASSSGESLRDGKVDLDSMPNEGRCRVLLLPPYYLVHLRPPLSSTVSKTGNHSSRY